MFQIGQCNLFSEDDGEVFEIKEYNLFRENYDKIKNKELIRYTFSKIKTQTSELNENPHPFEVDALLDKSTLNIKKNRLTFNLPLNISIADVFEEYDNLNTEERNSVQNIPLILEENGEILLLDILTRTDIDLIDNYDRLSSHQREFLKNIIEILNPHKKLLELLVLISNVNIYNIFIEYDKLSNDQSPVFKNIIKSLGGNSENVLRLFVGGEPGTGKSYLIKILKLWVEDILGNKIAISAPTKTGAMCIKGDTIHKLFRLPVDNDNKPSYKPLTSAELSILRRELNDVILFIIDDIYLVSSDLLGCIHIRLTEIYGTKGHSNCWFGGKHILLLGDLFLYDAVAFFPPVFCKINDPFIQKQVYETIFLTVRPNFEFNIWDLFEYDELTYNMRQEKDQNYLDLLRRLRSKTYDVKADTQIETREITANKFECDINQLYLFERPGDCNRFNHYMLSLKSNCKIKLQAIDEIVYSENYVHPCMLPEKVNYYFHLDENIIIANGSRVMLTADVGDFAAGSIANVICVHLPDAPKLQFVTVEFDNNKRVNIYRITSQYEASDGIFYTRLQFPFILAFALTILDSLGLQLNKISDRRY
uniref:ATP-dependent DNA helicase n=1 Tax=Xenopsylla cheopis TaxID=163159 RepID=A0A6M2DUN2_XENCH